MISTGSRSSNAGSHRAALGDPPPGRPGGEILKLTREECFELLAAHRFGRLAVSGDHAAPVIRPVNYRFDRASGSLLFEMAEGSKLHALLRAAQATFEIDGHDEATATGWSVIVTGHAEEVTRAQELRKLLASEPVAWAAITRPRWMRIRARTVTGRRLVQYPPAPSD